MTLPQSKIEKEIAITRWLTADEDMLISSGSGKTFSNQDVVREIQNDTEDGKMFVEMQLKFLRSFADGTHSQMIAAAQ